MLAALVLLVPLYGMQVQSPASSLAETKGAGDDDDDDAMAQVNNIVPDMERAIAADKEAMAARSEKEDAIDKQLRAKSAAIEALRNSGGATSAESDKDDDDEDDDDEESLLQTGSKEPTGDDGWKDTPHLDADAKSDFDSVLSGINALKERMQHGMQNVESLKMKLDKDMANNPGMHQEDSPHAEALLEVGTRMYANMRETREQVRQLKAKMAAMTAKAAGKQVPEEKPSTKYKKLDENTLAVAIGAISGMSIGPDQASSLIESFQTNDKLSRAFKAGLKLGTNAEMLKEGGKSLSQVQNDPDLLEKLIPFVPPGFKNALSKRLAAQQEMQSVEVAPDGNLRAQN